MIFLFFNNSFFLKSIKATSEFRLFSSGRIQNISEILKREGKLYSRTGGFNGNCAQDRGGGAEGEGV